MIDTGCSGDKNILELVVRFVHILNVLKTT